MTVWPFFDECVLTMVGIVRYRDRYKPAKSLRQTLRGLPTGTWYMFTAAHV